LVRAAKEKSLAVFYFLKTFFLLARTKLSFEAETNHRLIELLLFLIILYL
jgi:hypothetical protein